ncbi:hypothetical protein RUM43_005953, partial [Polyplax serrata]
TRNWFPAWCTSTGHNRPEQTVQRRLYEIFWGYCTGDEKVQVESGSERNQPDSLC